MPWVLARYMRAEGARYSIAIVQFQAQVARSQQLGSQVLEHHFFSVREGCVNICQTPSAILAADESEKGTRPRRKQWRRALRTLIGL
jgi:hypothetical protein